MDHLGLSGGDSAGQVYSNMVNRAGILNKKAVYERLGSHHGIIQYFKTSDQSIEVAFANQSDLSTYMQTYPLPSPKFRANWIQLLVDNLQLRTCYKGCHPRQFTPEYPYTQHY